MNVICDFGLSSMSVYRVVAYIAIIHKLPKTNISPSVTALNSIRRTHFHLINNHCSPNCAAITEIYRKITDISSKITIFAHDQDIIHQIGEHVCISMPIFKKWNVVTSHVIAVIGLSSVPILHVRGRVHPQSIYNANFMNFTHDQPQTHPQFGIMRLSTRSGLGGSILHQK
jgi:hypothetical protein